MQIIPMRIYGDGVYILGVHYKLYYVTVPCPTVHLEKNPEQSALLKWMVSFVICKSFSSAFSCQVAVQVNFVCIAVLCRNMPSASLSEELQFCYELHCHLIQEGFSVSLVTMHSISFLNCFLLFSKLKRMRAMVAAD